MPNCAYELKRLDEAFERLQHLQNEISCLGVKINTENCSDAELSHGLMYLHLAGELRELVSRYREDYEAYQEPSRMDRVVDWACAALKGGGA